AFIVSDAGLPGTVTIATYIAGRGTDIVLGGNWNSEVENLENPTDEQIAEIKAAGQIRHDAVSEAGGCHIISTERNAASGIDRQ
ncbi:hypothetical protein CWB68_20650, partial [Pseudoalteromonas sp. S979]|uniref:preprotein translocase subunit SecA n=1 Tax=Pseudoalteromonas sp. S979 TaxID=579570 RepID=UPI00110C7CA3